jgi:hypothetical protein
VREHVGRVGETEAHVKEPLRLSPRDPFAFLWANYAAVAKHYSGTAEEVPELCRQSIGLNRNYPLSHLFSVARCSCLSGRR